MKISLTIELDETELLAVGLVETGRMTPATQTEVRDYMQGIVMGSISSITAIVKARNSDALEAVNVALSKGYIDVEN